MQGLSCKCKAEARSSAKLQGLHEHAVLVALSIRPSVSDSRTGCWYTRVRKTKLPVDSNWAGKHPQVTMKSHKTCTRVQL